jgi:hypothetical protein
MSIGMDIDDFNLNNILIYKSKEKMKIKILNDEREKFYEKILEGYGLAYYRMKIFWSAEKI